MPGALFSGTLWFGNASYTYLSVSFIQMLKALMPAAVYTCSVIWVRQFLPSWALALRAPHTRVCVRAPAELIARLCAERNAGS